MDVFQGTDASPLPNRIKRSKLTEGREGRWIYMESRKWLMIDVTDVCSRQCGVSFSVATFLRRSSPTSILRTACDSIFMLLIPCVHEMCSCHVFKLVSFVWASGFVLVTKAQKWWVSSRTFGFVSGAVLLSEDLWVGPFLRCSSWNVCEKFVLKSNVNNIQIIQIYSDIFRYIQIIQHFDLLKKYLSTFLQHVQATLVLSFSIHWTWHRSDMNLDRSVDLSWYLEGSILHKSH